MRIRVYGIDFRTVSDVFSISTFQLSVWQLTLLLQDNPLDDTRISGARRRDYPSVQGGALELPAFLTPSQYLMAS